MVMSQGGKFGLDGSLDNLGPEVVGELRIDLMHEPSFGSGVGGVGFVHANAAVTASTSDGTTTGGVFPTQISAAFAHAGHCREAGTSSVLIGAEPTSP
jgi:hypothetical protein